MKSSRQIIFSEPIDGEGGKLVVHALNLVVLRTHNLERCRRFYEALGLRFSLFEYGYGARSMNGPVPPNAPLVHNVKAEGIPPAYTDLEIHTLGSGEAVPKQQIGFFVGSVDAALQAAVEAGGTLLSKPANWPYGQRSCGG